MDSISFTAQIKLAVLDWSEEIDLELTGGEITKLVNHIIKIGIIKASDSQDKIP